MIRLYLFCLLRVYLLLILIVSLKMLYITLTACYEPILLEIYPSGILCVAQNEVFQYTNFNA